MYTLVGVAEKGTLDPWKANASFAGHIFGRLELYIDSTFCKSSHASDAFGCFRTYVSMRLSFDDRDLGG